MDLQDEYCTLLEPRQGVHFARNTAAKRSNGELLYFTDDDMIADENLLNQIAKHFVGDGNKIHEPSITPAEPFWI